MEKLFTLASDGKSLRLSNLIKRGEDWYNKKISLGYKETPFGLLPMSEIKKAGFAWNTEMRTVWDKEKNAFVEEQCGYDSVPGEYLIAGEGMATLKFGEKYLAPTKQFIYWWKDYKRRMQTPKTIDEKIETEIAKQGELKLSDEITMGKAVDSIIDKDGHIDINKLSF